MRRLPQKSVKGANLKKWLVESIDALIDYLSDASYLQPGTGIGIDRTASGIMISALKPKSAPAQSLTGGADQDISATVSGGTATIRLSGSTSSVPVVAGSNVNITGGTNGEVIVSATGGTASGMAYPQWGSYSPQQIIPDWTESSGSYTMDPIVLSHSGYLRVYMNEEFDLSSENSILTQNIGCTVSANGALIYVYDRTVSIPSGSLSFSDTRYETQMIPVASGSTISGTYYNSTTGVSPGLSFYFLSDPNN